MTKHQKGECVRTRKNIWWVWGIVIFLGAAASFGGMKEASAEGRVGINLNLGSQLPQEVVVVPGGVYFVPDQGVDVFFYSGFWWATRDDQWYRARDYNGRWGSVDRRYVPAPVHRIYGVPNYREVYGRQDGSRVPYGQWKKNGHRDISQERHGDNGEGREHGEHQEVEKMHRDSDGHGDHGNEGKRNERGGKHGNND